MTTALETIKAKFESSQQQQREKTAAEYWQLVIDVADGKTPTDARLAKLISMETLPPKPTCPTSASHREIRKTVSRTDGMHTWVCDQCGADWKQVAEFHAVSSDGRQTIQKLEYDVELLLQRRRWRETLDGLKEAEKQKADIDAKLQAAEDKIRAAVDESKALHEKLKPELLAVNARISECENARNRLEQTAVSGQCDELQKRLRTLSGRRRDIKQDLWGYGKPGTFNDVMNGTTGSRLLSLQRQREALEGRGDVKSRRELETAKRREDDFFTREVDPLLEEWNQVNREIEQIEGELAILQAEKLKP